MPTPETPDSPGVDSGFTGPWHNVTSSAAYTGFSDQHIWRGIKRGDISAVKVGKRGLVRIPQSELDRWMASHPAYEPAS